MGTIIINRTILYAVCLLIAVGRICAGETDQDSILAKVRVEEVHGFARTLEYVDVSLQLQTAEQQDSALNIIAEEVHSGKIIPCQIVRSQRFNSEDIRLIHLVFPVSMEANSQKTFVIRSEKSSLFPKTDLSLVGNNFDLIVDNSYYKADMSATDQSEAKKHNSGQLRELEIKMGHDVRLFRTENRIHWAPNFQKKDAVHYSTIAGWEDPDYYHFYMGPYIILTEREDKAPDHDEIILRANYYFYAGLPFFRFYSSMEFTTGIWMTLLRNDEMTMDSLFTHFAVERADGTIEDLPFSVRYQTLTSAPVENTDPWICFYHSKKGYAFGSIRLKYDNTNSQGFESPTYLPYTKISDGAGGGKYWNRRLINEFPTFVPAGSRYVEENAYIVFSIDPTDKFAKIKYWADRLQNPLRLRRLSPEVE